jgi:enterochelin esterase family protein
MTREREPSAVAEELVTGVVPAGVRFRLADPSAMYAEVRVWLDLEHHVEPPPLVRVGDGWETTLRRPPVLRVEYLFLVRHQDGSEAMICDPANSRRVTTAFGDHSVLEFPGYEAPAWLATTASKGETVGFAVRAAGLRRTIAVTVWSPPGTTGSDPLPMLALHDGPELAQLAAVTQFSAAMIALGRLPAHRLALVSPGHRDSWYSASLAYAHALHRSVLPAVRNVVRVGPAPVLAGVSLGALAALHAATTFPGTWAALFLQSGSFFRRESDVHESRFVGFDAITRYVQSLDDAPEPTKRLDIGMTVGLAEENLTNNRVMAAALSRLGHRVTLVEVPDAHTFVGWRDAFDPHLTNLLARAWTGHRGAT